MLIIENYFNKNKKLTFIQKYLSNNDNNIPLGNEIYYILKIFRFAEVWVVVANNTTDVTVAFNKIVVLVESFIALFGKLHEFVMTSLHNIMERCKCVGDWTG